MTIINTTDETIDNGPKGLGGWLALLALGLLFSPIRMAKEAFDGRYPAEIWDALARHSYAALTLGFLETFFTWLSVAMILAAVIMFFMKSRHFPKAFIGFGFFTVGYNVLDYIATSIIFNVPTDTIVSSGDIAEAAGRMTPWLIWTLYLVNARRVANTFVE